MALKGDFLSHFKLLLLYKSTKEQTRKQHTVIFGLKPSY